MVDGQRIVFRGENDQEVGAPLFGACIGRTRAFFIADISLHLCGLSCTQPGMEPGDIIFAVKQKPHPTFTVKGLDLLTTVRLTLSEALLGFDRTIVTHLDGRNIKLSRPVPGQAGAKIVRPGDVERIRGEGMPKEKWIDQRGDLYIQWEVDFPEDSWLQSVDASVSRNPRRSQKNFDD